MNRQDRAVGVDVTTHQQESVDPEEFDFQIQKSIFRAIVNRFGPVIVSFAVTFGSMIMAVALTAALEKIFRGEVLKMDLFFAAVIAGILAPIISYGFIYLTGQLNLAEQQMRHLATTDGLTGVLNRRYFFERGENELQRAIRYGHPLSMLIFDIDHFKQVNDGFGHQAGDEVLCQLADITVNTIRSTDLLGRYGGEEFILMLPEAGFDSAWRVAERLRQKIETHNFKYDQEKIKITISVGLSSLESPDTDLEDLISRADRSLYAAKDAGRNRVGDISAIE
jgi:diguanylate cyclase (GGDEF)-like protein